uniref:Calpain catalytic domain-containing protein n=1 Tax=Chromera velia CCMP2878 TaxID=1169474 RepID=A0A0G4ICW7_9ALVE|eukprot:Cvel_13244.t1-p1 / transcript=Cvel_13244.t1 / gene=Cvel_13244 / organism=Chromera_velia_CCMP2878 / gene_product=Calpain-2 catalytic subunit, putative / transcript_product=Calpain-2 catalytic subunit, putative / location=Cvel_scaffold898:941-8632(+) / protein_length=743 / sequence_SO=supercontig / SO=protein_coding / is_pseudo=false
MSYLGNQHDDWYVAKGNEKDTRELLVAAVVQASEACAANGPFYQYKCPNFTERTCLKSAKLSTGGFGLGPRYMAAPYEFLRLPDIYGPEARVMPSPQEEWWPPRFYQGSLLNGYLIGAMQAVSLKRPLLEKLLVASDLGRGVHGVRFFKNGIWVTAVIDDFFPVDSDGIPIFCRVDDQAPVWPLLIEKGYARAHGSYAAIGGGGLIEEALVDLTGGVAGRFPVSHVAGDELFAYMQARLDSSLFVCDVDEKRVLEDDIPLATRRTYSVCAVAAHTVSKQLPMKRKAGGEDEDAMTEYSNTRFPAPGQGGGSGEGEDEEPDVELREVEAENLFVMLRCNETAGIDPFKSEIPADLSQRFKRRPADGVFWVPVGAFCRYFGNIIECRLIPAAARDPPRPLMSSLDGGAMMEGGDPLRREGQSRESTLLACAGRVDASSLPWLNFNVEALPPGGRCEIWVSLSQLDKRMRSGRSLSSPVALRVFERVGEDMWVLVCQSNWRWTRDSTVGFAVTQPGQFRLVTILPNSVSIHKSVQKSRTAVACRLPPPPRDRAAEKQKERLVDFLPEGKPPGVLTTAINGMCGVRDSADPGHLSDTVEATMREASKGMERLVLRVFFGGGVATVKWNVGTAAEYRSVPMRWVRADEKYTENRGALMVTLIGFDNSATTADLAPQPLDICEGLGVPFPRPEPQTTWRQKKQKQMKEKEEAALEAKRREVQESKKANKARKPQSQKVLGVPTGSCALQ